MGTNIARETKETKITADINIYGEGSYKIDIEDNFLKHMVETLAKYGNFDLKLKASGDNFHHLLEDVAITLGKAIQDAIKGKKINRIGQATVAMDDALVMAVVDLIDRPYVDVQLPDELYNHFMRSFALEARITLHVHIIKGKEPHHIIEASFKALGTALKVAMVSREHLLSTKDSVKWKR
ncbi:MAG: imidazoleglycerol-phosphate dehydratase [Thermoplasmata archaeon]